MIEKDPCPFDFLEFPFPGGLEERRRAYVRYCTEEPGGGLYSELVKLYAGIIPDEDGISRAAAILDSRTDCADFTMNGLVRLMYAFGESALMSETVKGRVRAALLGFKYWPDEPGIDGMCTWTENHQIMFAAGGYLAGGLYPDDVFENSGRTGREMVERFRPRILRWLDLRFRTGFSEWLSNVYYNEDMPPLLNLVQYGEDPEITERSRMVLDLLLLDVALNTGRGSMGCTHGRSYERHKKDGGNESTGSAMRLLFGVNRFDPGNMSAVSFLLTDRYRVPDVLRRIIEDGRSKDVENRQRMGIKVREARRWGLGFRSLEDGMTFLSLEAYLHPLTARLTLRMFDAFRWWENDFFAPFKARKALIRLVGKTWIMPFLVWALRKDLARNTREEVNTYTYRTPDTMLSSAQDYRKGYGGDQQHVWQATLGPEAVVFTTHPARKGGDGAVPSPNYWTGSGNLPRVGQVKNVAVIVYRISTRPGLYLTHDLSYTHAWFPIDRFDETAERNGWVFGRKGDGYVALWSKNPYRWRQDEGDPARKEIIVRGKRNIWVCETGRRAVHGSFDGFITAVSDAKISAKGLSVRYVSPTAGVVRFGWAGPLLADRVWTTLHGYLRYGNPYVRAEFPAASIRVECGGAWLEHDWTTHDRRVSGFLE